MENKKETSAREATPKQSEDNNIASSMQRLPDEDGLDKHALDKEKSQRNRGLIELIAILLPLFVLGIASTSVNPILEFNRPAIDGGSWYRLFTCNFVHLGVNHMLLNLCGYVFAVLLFKRTIGSLWWYSNSLVCCIAVGLGILFFDKGVASYVGLSGALYGILAFGLLINLRDQLWINLVIYCFIIYRVFEQNSEAFDPASMHGFIGGNVIASSHLFGLIAGNLCAGTYFIVRVLSRQTTSDAESHNSN